mgnify:CR=1 FL=1
MLYRFHISYRTPDMEKPYLTGKNIEQDTDCMLTALKTFLEQIPEAKVQGIMLCN